MHGSAPPDSPIATVERDEAEAAGDRGLALDALKTRYSLRSPEEVTAYLRSYPHLVPLLLEAAEVIPRYFGADTHLVLEVVVDPEDESETPELYASVQTRLGVDEGLDRLDRLDEDWWLDRSPAGPGVLVVDIEFL